MTTRESEDPSAETKDTSGTTQQSELRPQLSSEWTVRFKWILEIKLKMCHALQNWLFYQALAPCYNMQPTGPVQHKQKKDCFLSLTVDDILSCPNKILLRWLPFIAHVMCLFWRWRFVRSFSFNIPMISCLAHTHMWSKHYSRHDLLLMFRWIWHSHWSFSLSLYRICWRIKEKLTALEKNVVRQT